MSSFYGTLMLTNGFEEYSEICGKKGNPEAVLPPGGEIAVGQELTDFSQGLDDGFEGELYGFNLVTGPWEGLGRSLFETNFHQCTVRGGGSPPPDIDPHSQLIVDWAKTPFRAYGGAIVAAAKPSCGDF
ncbi:hypothetical protein J437_LFUL001853 [Ladona fulva]|uniref:Uncharacterized protein n=1 Tax=Ladona fulva TaxID=123851 RepID=A0A8K0JTU3_LADFU|nr:hypothetical protein J437_LFUL001853 [Ladona fulva]